VRNLRSPYDRVGNGYAGPIVGFEDARNVIQSDGVHERRIQGNKSPSPPQHLRPVYGTFIMPGNNPRLGPPARGIWPNYRPYAIALSPPKVKKLSSQTIDRGALSRSHGDQSDRIPMSTVANDISAAIKRRTPKRGG
jgi:hypothetical protein